MQISNHPLHSNCKVVTIKTYPYLKKFLKAFYKTDSSGAIRMDKHRVASTLMSVTLIKKEKLSQRFVERMTEEITISLNFQQSNYSLRNHTILQFNIEMDKFFKEQMYLWIIAQSFVGISETESIRSFQKKFSINESEYGFDNMYRAWQRYKNSEYEKKNNNNSLAFAS